MTPMSQLPDIVIQGILLGGLYTLFASGLSLIFGVMRLVNLAHGDLIVLAAYLTLAIATELGGSVLLGFLVAAPVMFAFGYVLQRGLLNRVVGRDILPPLLTTFGLSIILQNGMLTAFSADSRRLSAGGLDSASLALGRGLTIGVLPLLTLLAAIAVIIAINQLFYRTALGQAFRAVSDDPVTAQLMGIDHRQLFAVALGLAMVVCAIAGLFLGLRANFDPTIGPGRLIFAFEAVIIGGLGSLWGTLAGGIILGLAQTFGAALNPEWQLLAGHLAFLAVLAIRPRGLFPRAID
jgi:branched-chain amino acid transport system permease protein